VNEHICPGISGIRPAPLPKPKANITWLTSKDRSRPFALYEGPGKNKMPIDENRVGPK